MLKKAVFNALGFLKNLPGFSTKRRIVVIESDDWGSIRMPSKEAYNKLVEKGYKLEKDPYSKYDTLATEKDLTRIFEVFSKYKDQNGRHPQITANSVVANPDFKRIKASQFKEYHYELFTDTLKTYPGCEGSFALWEKGRDAGLFYPQFHGREHLNIRLWLQALQSGIQSALDTFELNMFAVNSSDTLGKRDNYMAAFDFYDSNHEKEVIESAKDGLRLFEKIHGYKSKSFIAPCYTWSDSMEKAIAEMGVETIQGILKRKTPTPGKTGAYKNVYHYMGKRSKFGQRYLMRNAYMEASHTKSWGADYCLKAIGDAFKMNKPAIIGSHRVNFLGGHDEKNQLDNLKEFETIFSTLLNKWPNVEFMHSAELGALIHSKGKRID